MNLEETTEVSRDGATYREDHRRDELVYAAGSMVEKEELVGLMMSALHESH